VSTVYRWVQALYRNHREASFVVVFPTDATHRFVPPCPPMSVPKYQKIEKIGEGTGLGCAVAITNGDQPRPH